MLLVSISAQAQVVDWQDHPDKTYVFEITNKEAEKLLKSNPEDSLVLKMLHAYVTSFSREWENRPEKGHFIFAEIHKNKVNYNYVPVMPFQVFLFKEYGVLTLQVVDKDGNVRDNANVKIKGKWRFFDTGVSFDKESKTYTIDDWSETEKRILTVELDKFKAVFNLNKYLVNPWNGRDNGSGSSPGFYSYMITDKNKYKPGETVRFKSYALSSGKRPLKKELEVWMKTTDYEYKKITSLAPYHPGGYAGEIRLHDSLNLKLDRYYYIQLRDEKSKVVANTSFRYEDYLLADNKLEVELKSSVQYYPDTNRVEIKVSDANGLLLQDVKAEVLIRRRSVDKSYADILIMPDTIMHQKINLDNMQPTTVDIPAALFGESDCSYDVQVLVLSHDNQRMMYNNTVTFFRSNYDLDYSMRNDTLCFEFLELGKTKRIQAKLSYNDSKEDTLVDLPYEEAFRQAIQKYTFEIPELKYVKSILSEDIDPELDLTGGFSADSFNISLINPLALDVSWYIYQGNILLQKGFGKELDFECPNTELDVTHYVEIFYFMGNTEQVFRRAFVPKTEHLSVETDLPDRIYPGQQLDATVTVKDNWGKPVKDVDITAFAVNSLLDYYVPSLPYYGTPPRTREMRSSYSIDKRNFAFSTSLDYTFWNKLAHLDELNYYRFTYPRNGMFMHTVNTPDSTTQVAPYVMKDGDAVNIYVIGRNDIPVYFSWTDQPKAYSFVVSDTAKQELSLRLHDRVIMFDSMRFEPGKKTIISIDLDHLPENVRVLMLDYKNQYNQSVFTEKERGIYKQYISRIPVKNERTDIYLKQGGDIFYVHVPCLAHYRSSILAGPVPPGKTRYVGGIEYKHEGGFYYEFDDNVVYKYPEQVWPDYLQFTSSNKITSLNDFCLTKKVMDKILEECKNDSRKWRPQNIHIVQDGLNMKFCLPLAKDSAGISNLLFRNRETNAILFPDKFENNVRKYSKIPEGIYDVILLYNDGEYLEYNNIPFRTNAYIEVNMRRLPVYERDSLSEKWLSLRIPTYSAEERYYPEHVSNPVSTFYARPVSRNAGNTVKGSVSDDSGEPLIGVTVHLKGTNYGAITDIDGHFDIEVSSKEKTLVFSYLGFKTKEMDVSPGSEVSIVLEEDQMLLDEVVVVGYGTQRKYSLAASVSVIKSDSYMSVPPPPAEEFEETYEYGEKKDAEDKLYNELLQINGLRTNFSDVGFWEPRLYTDKKGKAGFSVTFPDNITKWDAVVYAMNRKLKTGTARKPVKSYKPLMAELRTPQFMVEGDSSYFAGNIRNYTKEIEISGTILFALKQDTLINGPVVFASSHQDKMLVTAAETDSIESTYLFTRNDGYQDGEKRSIPVEKQGTEIAEGTLAFLRNGDKLDVTANRGENIHISITGKQLDVYMDATYYLTGYKYACNEQLASKLIGLLNYKIYQQYMKEKFNHDKNINEIIKCLIDNRNNNKLWSWWGNSSATSYWMSAHVLRALQMAQSAGYQVNTDVRKIEQDYTDTRSYRYSSLYDIEVLHALSEWGTTQNYEGAVRMFENEIRKRELKEDSIARKNDSPLWNSYLKEKLLLWEIRQKQNLGYSSDSISKYLKKDVLGAVYCDDGIRRPWYSDNLSTTLIAYRIIKRDSALSQLAEPMQMYILSTKQYGWNTYQASSAVSTVLPDLFAASFSKDKPATVLLTGKEHKELTEFPYKTELAPGENLHIEKKDGMPLIYSAYTIKRVTNANQGDAFDVSTSLSSGDTVKAGEPVTLNVNVKVKQKNAEHIMIEVPLPAGCSYASKPNYFYGREVHREYFKEKTVIFCESLPEGTYNFEIQLLPRFTGKYHMNPAKVEMMYFPVINSNNDMRKVDIIA